MKKNLNKLLLASSISLVLAGASATALGQSASKEVNNARHEAQIETTYTLSPYLRSYEIDVDVIDGKATLSGIVDEEISKDLARQIALGVKGIESVDNQIEVKNDHVREARTGNERSFGEVVDDASITAAVKSKLLWSTYTDGMDTKVESRNGVVTLTGTAGNAESRELANMLARNTQGVRAVDNQLTVTAGKSKTAETKAAVKDAGQSVSDTWITTKVRSTYLMSNNIQSRDIDVTTSEGVVTLSGTVQSAAEKALAVELARNIKGVTRVTSPELKL
ncbi:BON domain-containing protein [Halopseudomonas sp.]|uniref:BON domain-containing protein n=1 Tax=Halopseudomonas sp. TaxID=2901191 RepID=UPI0035630ADD